MRVLLDANIWISYLLTPSSGTISRVVEACFASSVTLVFPVELQSEFRNSVARSRYLSQRIPAEAVADLIDAVSTGALVPPPLTSPLDSVSRDVGDDYLVAYGLLYAVDLLVTGDRDLLVLGQIDALSIVTPTVFVKDYVSKQHLQ